MMIIWDVLVSIVFWSAPLYLVLRIFYDSTRCIFLIGIIEIAFFFIFFLSFFVACAFTYIFYDDWARLITEQKLFSMPLVKSFLMGHWIGDGGYHDIPLKSVFLLPYIGVVEWVKVWFKVSFLSESLILQAMGVWAVTFTIKVSRPFLIALELNRTHYNYAQDRYSSKK